MPDPNKWFPVEKTHDEWRAAAGGRYVLHQDTAIRFEDGRVFVVCLIGAAFIGFKNADGSINMHGKPLQLGETPPVNAVALFLHTDPPWDQRIMEAADPDFPNGCHRAPDGAIVCTCPDDY